MNSRLHGRRLLGGATALVLGLAMVATGCSGGTGPATAPGEGPGAAGDVTLNIWLWANEARAAFEGGIIEAFEAEHPGIKLQVTVQPDKDYQTMLTTGLSGSGGPDVAAIRSYGVITTFADSGNLVPLDDVVTDWSGFSDTAKAANSSRTDGKIYAVPQGMQTAQIYYNKKIFADNNLNVPTTWDEFLAACETLKAAGVIPLAMPGNNASHTALAGEVLGNARRGGSEFADKFVAGETDLNDPNYVASLQLVADLLPYVEENATAVTLDDAIALFSTGQAAMIASGTFLVATLAGLKSTIDYGIFNTPANADWPSGEVTVSYGDGGWALSNRSEHPEQAKVLMNWLASAEFVNLYTNAMGTLPGRDGVTLTNEVLNAQYQNMLKNPSPNIGIAYGRYGNPWLTDLYGEQVQKLWLGQTDAATAAGAIQTGINAWFKPADFK